MHRHLFARATRRNFWLNVANGSIMMGTNNSVASPDLVMTTFAAHLTSNPIILGVITPLPGATWSLPQLFMIRTMQRLSRTMPIYRISAFVRTLTWIELVIAPLVTHNKIVLLLSLFSFIVIGGLASGISGLPFIDITGKTIPPNQRGQLFGLRSAIGGLLAIVGSQVVILLTGPGTSFDFPVSYGWLFLVAAIAQIAGMVAFMKIDEPDTNITIRREPLSLHMIGSIWQADSNYRRYVWGRTFTVLAGMANGLVIVYANQQLGVRLELSGAYLLASSLLSPVFSVIAGRLSVRIGNRLPVAGGMAMLGLSWALLLIAQPLGLHDASAERYMFLVYALVALYKGLVFSNMMALGLNITPEDDHALYMGAVNTWVGLVLLATMLSGAIAEWIGYQALFVLMLVCSLAAAWAYGTLVEDWRQEDDPA